MTSEPYVVPNVPRENYEPSAPRRWPLAVWIVPDAVVALIVTVVLTIIFMLGYLAVQAVNGLDFTQLLGPNGTQLPPGLVFGSILLQNLSFIAVVLLRTRVLRKLPLRWLGFNSGRLPRLLGWGVVFGLLFVGLNFLIGLIFQYFGITSDQAQQFQVERGDVLGQVLLVLAGVIIAPIGEEVLFRGYVFNALRENSSRRTVAVVAAQLALVLGLPLLLVLGFGVASFGDLLPLLLSLAAAFLVAVAVPSMRVRAYLLSAAFFAVVHLSGISQGAAPLLAATFVGGLCLAGAYDRTGSIIPAMIAHGINNSVAFGNILYCVNTYGSVQNCG